MKRNNILLKKRIMCRVQKENSWKPFIMYNLFDQLEDIFEKYPDFCKLQSFQL